MEDARKQEVENFTQNIRWIRKHYRFTKKEMAEKLKIGIKSLTKIEQGQIPPRLSADILLRIHDSFGISPDTLFREYLGDSSNTLSCPKSPQRADNIRPYRF